MSDSGDENDFPDVVPIPVKWRPPEPHEWAEPESVAPHDGRHQQTERKCTRCPLVKITVHPPGGGGYRQYRFADGAQFYDRIEPECVPTPSIPSAAAER